MHPTSCTVVAVDWSGRGGSDQARYIWLCEVVDGEVVRLESGRSRAAIVDYLACAARGDAPLVVGFDFAFSVPEWYLHELELTRAKELWELVAREDLTPRMREVGLRRWIQDPEWPFWRTGRPADLTRDRAFRRTDLEVTAPRIQPKSVFQLVGAGMVGPGSLYGMQALHELSQAGYGIWPFDPRGPRMVVEIFPRTLTGPVVKRDRGARETVLRRFDLDPRHRASAVGSEDAFDALVSALTMAAAADELAQLDEEPAYGLEGRIWTTSAIVRSAAPKKPPLRDDVFVPRELRRLDGSEKIGETGSRIGDFWSWAFSDLRSNTERGVFAEFLVARAVGDDSPLRETWANYDLTTPSGIRVEVKASGYLQSWQQKKLSEISFGRLMALAWDAVTGELGAEPEVRADVFVFAIQTCRDPDAYEVLDIDQWEFRVMSADVIRENPLKSVGISFLDLHAPRRLRWNELRDAVEEAGRREAT